MMDLQLDIDEGILLQTTEVTRYTDKEIHCQEIYLTNKNIICVCEKSNGLFKKPDTYIESIHLDTIKVINGFAQVLKIDDDNYGFGMQILFKNGKREYFAFCDNDKVISRWINTVKGAVTGSIRTVEDITNTTTNRKNNKAKIFAEVSGVLSMDVNSIIDKASKKITEFTEEMPQKIVNKLDQTIGSIDKPIEQLDLQPENETVVESITEVFSEAVNSNSATEDVSNNIFQKPSEEKKFIFCSNCGEKLIKGSKFCNSCGSPVGAVVVKETTEIKQETVQSETAEQIHAEEITERKTVYDGKLYKCPNCGEVLKSFTSNCPLCGYEIRGTNTASAVRELSAKLEVLELRRDSVAKNNVIKNLYFGQAMTKTDEQKISLIRNFSIPNTKEDLYEFFILSKSNIDADLYVNDNPMRKGDVRLAISDAWKAKFEQAYQKAKLIFNDDPRMVDIQTMYDSLHKSIKRAKTQIWKVLGLVYGILFGFAAIGIIITIITSPNLEKKEIERLESIVIDVQTALNEKEYKLALNTASSIDYQLYDAESERKWDIQRDYWVDKVIDESAKNDIKLEYTPSEDVDNTNNDSPSDDKEKGFTKGFSDSLEDGKDEVEKNVDEFKKNLNKTNENSTAN